MTTLRGAAQILGISSVQISVKQLAVMVGLKIPVSVKDLLKCLDGALPTSTLRLKFSTWFPNLKLFTIKGPATGNYNCISWSVGITDQWLWPGYTVAAFDSFYASYGWKPSANGDREYQKRKVALWGFASDDCTHGSRETSDCDWHESKCGPQERIKHDRFQMQKGSYGDIIKYYEKYDKNANLHLAP